VIFIFKLVGFRWHLTIINYHRAFFDTIKIDSRDILTLFVCYFSNMVSSNDLRSRNFLN
jgi:hypothetical protein